jgi:predicted acyl esterase
VLRLWLESTAADADVIARIDDVAPDGTATYRTVEGRLRASMRKQTDAPYDNLGLPYHPFTEDSVEPLTPGEPALLEFDFYMISNLFRAGHRIRLTLNFADQRSTPRLDPAPTVRVHHGGELDSALILPVIPG